MQKSSIVDRSTHIGWILIRAYLFNDDKEGKGIKKKNIID